MPKMKSKKAMTKRVKVSATGKIIRHHAYTSHNAHHKTTKQKKQLAQSAVMDKTDVKREKALIQK